MAAGKKAQIDNDMEHEAMDKNDDGTVDYWEQKEWFNEKNTLSVSNALLWSLASLFEQGGERHPKSWSGMVLGLCIPPAHTMYQRPVVPILTSQIVLDVLENK